jgi:hypothetical protein
MVAPRVTAPSSIASANATLVGRFGRTVTMLVSRLPIGRPQSIAPQGRMAQRLPVPPVGNQTRLRSPPKAAARRAATGCLPTTTLGTHCSGRSEGMVAAGDGVRLGPVRLSCLGGGRAGCAELAGSYALGQPASPSSSKQSGHGRWVWYQGGLRWPPQAVRAEGPPRARTRRWINRAKRTLRRGRSTPLEGAINAHRAGWCRRQVLGAVAAFVTLRGRRPATLGADERGRWPDRWWAASSQDHGDDVSRWTGPIAPLAGRAGVGAVGAGHARPGRGALAGQPVASGWPA